MIFPGDAQFIKVVTGRPADRVYMLQFQNNRRFFFWLQDKDDKDDAELTAKLNECVCVCGGGGCEEVPA